MKFSNEREEGWGAYQGGKGGKAARHVCCGRIPKVERHVDGTQKPDATEQRVSPCMEAQIERDRLTVGPARTSRPKRGWCCSTIHL